MRAKGVKYIIEKKLLLHYLIGIQKRGCVDIRARARNFKKSSHFQVTLIKKKRGILVGFSGGIFFFMGVDFF